MEDHDDFAFEPVPGLPETLPRGETMLWQGSPDWKALAISAFHVRKVAVYFALLLAWKLATASGADATASGLAMTTVWLSGLAAASVGILALLAYYYARGTIYTLTSKRIVIRSGLALPVTLNLPLALIETAAQTKQPLGTDSIALAVARPNRVAWLVLWPNARPWNFTNPQPMLRCLRDAKAVTPLLAKALEAETAALPARAPARAKATTSGAAMPAGATVAA
jgi:hypothetical protein